MNFEDYTKDKTTTSITQESQNRRQNWVIQKPPKVSATSKRNVHTSSQQEGSTKTFKTQTPSKKQGRLPGSFTKIVIATIVVFAVIVILVLAL